MSYLNRLGNWIEKAQSLKHGWSSHKVETGIPSRPYRRVFDVGDGKVRVNQQFPKSRELVRYFRGSGPKKRDVIASRDQDVSGVYHLTTRGKSNRIVSTATVAGEKGRRRNIRRRLLSGRLPK